MSAFGVVGFVGLLITVELLSESSLSVLESVSLITFNTALALLPALKVKLRE